jgi:hypothetical protein
MYHFGVALTVRLHQFGVSLAAYLGERKLVRMLGNILAMWLLGWRLCKLHGSSNIWSAGFRSDSLANKQRTERFVYDPFCVQIKTRIALFYLPNIG